MTPEQVWIVLEALDNVLTDSDSLLFLVLGQQLGDHLCAHLAHFEIFSVDAPDSVLVDGKFLSNIRTVSRRSARASASHARCCSLKVFQTVDCLQPPPVPL